MCAQVGDIWHTTDGQCYDEMNRNLWMVLLNAVMQTEEGSWSIMPVSESPAAAEGDEDEVRPDDGRKYDGTDGLNAGTKVSNSGMETEGDHDSVIGNPEDRDSAIGGALQGDDSAGDGAVDDSGDTKGVISKVISGEEAETDEVR